MPNASRQQLIQNLKEQLRGLERANRPAASAAVVSTGLDALDRLLPAGGLEPGTLIEWLGAGAGSGTATLALTLAARVLEKGGALVVIDDQREFYPRAAGGVPLERTVVVQPGNPRDALWALEQALRSGAAAVVLGRVGKLSARMFRRLQLAAEAGASLGFLLRPASCRAEPSWAEARFLGKALPGAEQARRLRVELLQCRGRNSGVALELELSDEAGHVRLVSGLAHPASAPRVAGEPPGVRGEPPGVRGEPPGWSRRDFRRG